MTRRGKRNGAAPNFPPSLAKRLRLPPPAEPLPLASNAGVVVSGRGSSSSSSTSSNGPSVVVVVGLPPDCTVLELKSRLEVYGAISRIRIDAEDGRGYVTFRSNRSSGDAIAASLDPDFGVFVASKKVLVIQAPDPPPVQMEVPISAVSKLLRAQIPLSRHGRSSKKLSASAANAESEKKGSDMPNNKSREIVVYDDLF